jgi:hypothetical protein
MRFAPRYNAEAFKCFVVTGSGWGQFTQAISTAAASVRGQQTASLALLSGSLTLGSLGLDTAAASASATLDGAAVAVSIKGGLLTFSPKVTIKQGSSLAVTLGAAAAVALDIQAPPAAPLTRRRVPDAPPPAAKPAADGAAPHKGGGGLSLGHRATLLAMGAVLVFTMGALFGRFSEGSLHL